MGPKYYSPQECSVKSIFNANNHGPGNLKANNPEVNNLYGGKFC